MVEPLRASILNGLVSARASLSNTRSTGNATLTYTTNQSIEIQPAVVNKLNKDETPTGQEDSLSSPEQKVTKHTKKGLYYIEY